jgi:hypothetical protein
MLSFQLSDWDATVSSLYHQDGAALEVPFRRRTRSQERRLFLFTRRITYKMPDDSMAELEVIVVSSRIWRPDESDESRGWKVLPLGLGMILAIRLTVLPNR